MKYKKIELNQKNITDFSKVRNDLELKTDSEWVFFVDTDEKVTKKLSCEISRIRPKGNFKYAYFLKRNNFFLGEFVGEDKIIRLYKKGSGRWVRSVHEYYKIDRNVTVKTLKNKLIHNTADSLKSYLEKINFYSSLHAKQNTLEGKKSGILKIIFWPLFKFFITLIKSRNIVFSIMQSLHSFLSWSKQYLKEK